MKIFINIPDSSLNRRTKKMFYEKWIKFVDNHWCRRISWVFKYPVNSIHSNLDFKWLEWITQIYFWWALDLISEMRLWLMFSRTINKNEIFYSMNANDVIREIEKENDYLNIIISAKLVEFNEEHWYKRDQMIEIEEDFIEDFKWPMMIINDSWIEVKNLSWTVFKRLSDINSIYHKGIRIEEFLQVVLNLCSNLTIEKDYIDSKYNFVFEWTDKSWKSSIANDFIKENKTYELIGNITWINEERKSFYIFSDVDWFDENLMYSVFNTYNNVKWNFIFDRWIPTNLVYWKVLRWKTDEENKIFYSIENEVHKNNNMVNCIFLPLESDAKRRCSESTEESWLNFVPNDKEIAKDIWNLIEWFKEYIENTKVKTIVFDQTTWKNQLFIRNFDKKEMNKINNLFKDLKIYDLSLNNFEEYSKRVCKLLKNL